MQWSKTKIFTLIMCILPVVFLSGCTEKKIQVLTPIEPLILVDNGTCNVSIHNIAGGTPSTVETFAAEELQAAFQLASGTAPSINPALPAEIEIRLGVSDLFSEGVGDADEQAYTVRRTTDGHIELVGNCKGAVMWAVDDFCKEVLHVSWPISTDIMMLQGSRQSTITVGQLNKVEAPDFGVRGWIIGANTDGHHYDDTIGKWMAHNRQNTIHELMPEMEQGYDKILSRGITVDTTFHNFFWLVPADVYYDDHPEYFPLINGVRLRPVGASYYAQLCISNPDVFDIVVQKVIQGFIDYPEIGVFGVAQSDGGGGWCQCDNCAAMDGDQAGTGVYSNRLIRFVNAIADTIGPTHPGKYIGMSAYEETIQPPDIDIADNVSITFCYGGMGNYMRKLTDPNDSKNAEVMAYLNGWLNRSDNVLFWAHYWTTDMESCITPYSRTIIEAFSDLKALGFDGITGQTYPDYWPGQRLFFYAMARASWDNSVDYNDILYDYCNEAYGPAGSDMESFHRLYEDKIYESVPFLSYEGPALQFFLSAFDSADMAALSGYLNSSQATVAGGFQAYIDAVAEVNDIFGKFKALYSEDPCDIPGASNLILNPGAESGSANWSSSVGGGSYSLTISTDGPRSGSNSFKIECVGATGNATWSQSGIPTVPGKTYVARFWFRASGGASGYFWGLTPTTIVLADSGDEWVRVISEEFTVTGSSLNLNMSNYGPGTIYFDDIYFTEVP